MDLQRHLHRGGTVGGRGAVVDPCDEAIGGVLIGAGRRVHIGQAAVDHVLLGEHRTGAEAVAVEREVAVARQVGDAVDDLLGRLRAGGDLRIDRLQGLGADHGHAGPTVGGDLVDGLRGVGHRDGVVRRGDRDVQRMAGRVRGRIRHVDVDGRARGRVAQLDVRGDEGQLVQPCGGVGDAAGETVAAGHGGGRGAGDEAALGCIGHGGGHRHGAAAVDGPAAQGAAIRTGRVERARLGHAQSGAGRRDAHAACRSRQLDARRGHRRGMPGLFHGRTAERRAGLVPGLGRIRVMTVRLRQRRAVVHLARFQRIAVGTRTEDVRIPGPGHGSAPVLNVMPCPRGSSRVRRGCDRGQSRFIVVTPVTTAGRMLCVGDVYKKAARQELASCWA